MSQYMLLLLELCLVAAAGYFFWSTRKLLGDYSHRLNGSLQPEQVDAMEMARDMAELLAELQTMAGTVRADLTMQSTTLQETLGRAELVALELKRLLAKTDLEGMPSERAEPTAPAPARSQIESRPISQGQPPAGPKRTEAKVVPAKNTQVQAVQNFGEALADYAKFLHHDDRSGATIARLEGHVREFLTWLAGKRYNEAPLSRIDATEFDAYISYLETQNYRPATLKRKLAALRSFSSWVETVLNGELAPHVTPDELPIGEQIRPEPVEVDSALAPLSQVNHLVGQSRYQAVMAMADEGVEQATIAARTGLEQEAIRMMLKLAPPSSLKH